jgi:hypothetical protein
MPLSDIDCACGGEGDVVGSARASEVGMVDELVYVVQDAHCALGRCTGRRLAWRSGLPDGIICDSGTVRSTRYSGVL